MKILHVPPAFYPATRWGGPTFSVYALCNHLAQKEGVVLRVLTSNCAGPQRTDNLPITACPQRYDAGYDVYFTRRILGKDIAPGLCARLIPLVQWADIVHLTSTYSFPTLPTLSVCRLLNKPVIWSPRGALQAAAEWSGSSKQTAKKVFERSCQLIMPKDTVLHVTAEMERELSLKRIPGMATALIPNGVDVPPNPIDRAWRPGGRLRLIYFSRLDPKKGLENLLDAMPRLPEPVSLDIYGGGDPAYTNSLERRVADHALGARVTFHGHVTGEAKSRAFQSGDLFVLPSYTENFGIVVAEAMAHGLPVITSTNTPWHGVTDRDCGAWVKNDPETLEQTIRSFLERDLPAMGQRGRAWMQEDFSWPGLADDFISVYATMLEKRRMQKASASA